MENLFKKNENYGPLKSFIVVSILLSSIFIINLIFTKIVICTYPYFLGYILYFLIFRDCVVPAVNEEIMRHISCQNGYLTAFLFPLSLALIEHYYIFSTEPFVCFLLRIFLHLILTATHLAGLCENKPKLYLVVAILVHFFNNLNAALS